MAGDAVPAVWLLSADIMNQSGGGFRQQRWCEYILTRGERVRLFHLDGAMRVRWADVSSVEDLRARRAEWIAGAPTRSGVRDSRAARLFRLVKHVFLLDLLLPSVFRLAMLLHGMLRQQPGRIALLCSSPPYSVAVVGRIMKALHNGQVILVLDMRDFWSLHSAFPGPKVHKRMVERWVIGGVDMFTTVAPALASLFEASFGRRPEVAFNVATQARQNVSAEAALDWEKIDPALRTETRKIVYTGSIPAGFYDLDALLDAIEAFARHPDAASLQFVFVGAGGELLSRVPGRAIPADMIVFIPQVRHEVAAAIQNAADALLFLGYRAVDDRGQVSIKLFEYFRRQRPILPVRIHPGSDVDGLIRLYCDQPCPALLDTTALMETFADFVATGGATLPRARDIEQKDAALLQPYENIADRIVASVRSGGVA